MAKHKNRHDLMEEIEGAFLDDPEAEIADEEITSEAAEAGRDAALRAEVADLKDRLLRALADVENIRKRAERDRRDAELYGATRFARDLLSVHDNFDRALGNVTDAVRAGRARADRGHRADPARPALGLREAPDPEDRRRSPATASTPSCTRRCSRRRCPAPRPATSSR